MPSKKYPGDFKVRGEGQTPWPPGTEHSFATGPETGLQLFEVNSLDGRTLLELHDFLSKHKINLSQALLNSGEISRGYAKIISKIDGDKIAIRLGDSNYIITGTVPEFIAALKTVQ